MTTTELFADQFALQRELGRGSFGVVHLALDTRLRNRGVALKILHPQLAVDPATLRLFHDEAGTMASLRHDNVVTLYNAGIWQGQRYLVMDFIDGPSLSQMVAEEGAQPPELVVDWLRQAASALAAAHAEGVIHRDLKAANLLWERARNRIYLTDFGLAKAVEASGGSSNTSNVQTLTGTAAYRAPEVRKTGHTIASDLYSLGVVAYELLAGQRPFVDNDPLNLMLAHATDAVPPLSPTIPAPLIALVERLLAKEPADRLARAADLLAALTDALSAPTIPAQVRTTPSVQSPVTSHQSPSAQSPVTSHQSPISFDWVTIPAGEFLMGSDKSKDEDAWDDETPPHRLYLPEYRIARTPVTVVQFEIFVKATGYRTTAEEEGSAWGYTGEEWEEIKGAYWRQPRGLGSDVRTKADHPVTCVSWLDVRAFCDWAGVRLPSEAEWEKAARGSDGRIYPWGNHAPPVGRYPKGASAYGLLDMAGNVWEWTSTRWGDYESTPGFAYPYNPDDGREDLGVGDSRVVRGGGWWSDRILVRCAIRSGDVPYYRDGGRGFRVVGVGVPPSASGL